MVEKVLGGMVGRSALERVVLRARLDARSKSIASSLPCAIVDGQFIDGQICPSPRGWPKPSFSRPLLVAGCRRAPVQIKGIGKGGSIRLCGLVGAQDGGAARPAAEVEALASPSRCPGRFIRATFGLWV